MDRGAKLTVFAMSSFPRRRGDGPVNTSPSFFVSVFPPQARGWTCRRLSVPALPAVSPAGAGMDPRGRRRCGCESCFPRRRGDGPLTMWVGRSRCWFPPQARGWTVGGGQTNITIPVSPAGAGMDPTLHLWARSLRGFPRRRGDGPFCHRFSMARNLFPPQARGWTRRKPWSGPSTKVSPVGAGMDPSEGSRQDGLGCFPRRRGDGPHVERPSL